MAIMVAAPLKSTLLLLIALLAIECVACLTFPYAKNNKGNASKAIGNVQVCQNKDCCQRWSLLYQSLPETIQDLFPPDIADCVEFEITSCLGLCGKGPNLCIKKRGSKEVFLNAISGPMSLADELQEKLGIQIPSKLVAAVTVMEKAHHGTFLLLQFVSTTYDFPCGCNIRVANLPNTVAC